MLDIRQRFYSRSISNESQLTKKQVHLRRMDSMSLNRGLTQASIYLFLEMQLTSIERSRIFSFGIILLTFLALIVPDVDFFTFNISISMNSLDGVILAFVLVFSFEVVSRIFVNPSYLLSYDFFVDFFASLTLLCELPDVHSDYLWLLLADFGRKVRIVRFVRLVHAWVFPAIPRPVGVSSAPSLFRRGSQMFEQVLADEPLNIVSEPLPVQVSHLVESLLGKVFIGSFFLLYLIRSSFPYGHRFVLLETIFSIVVLFWFNRVFKQISNLLVLAPLASIVDTMSAIQANPMCANELIAAESKLGDYHTRQLHRTILKFGSLLLVGFGETTIAGRNTRRRGTKTCAIFGYIAIADFGIVTEVLQDKICVLVNQVAEIVHGLVNEFGGFTLRSDGPGFLVIWKNPSSCSLAVISFCLIIAAINQSAILASYRLHPHLQMRIPNYSVQVHLGLHFGSGIEGAIGSEFKLNPAFLGPDIMIAQRMQNLAAQVYKKRFLLTGSVFKNVSPGIKKKCRQIDSINKIDVFTIDLDCSELTVKLAADSGARLKIQQDPSTRFQFAELYLMRAKHESRNGQLFRQLFNKAFLNYACGEWEVARKALRQTILFWLNRGVEITPKYFSLQYESDADLVEHAFGDPNFDGPSVALLQHIIGNS